MPVTTREFMESELQDIDPEEISSAPWRHGRKVTYVATLDDGTSWKFTVDVHHSEGWQTVEPITAMLVRQVEKTVKVWEPVL